MEWALTSRLAGREAVPDGDNPPTMDRLLYRRQRLAVCDKPRYRTIPRKARSSTSQWPGRILAGDWGQPQFAKLHPRRPQEGRSTAFRHYAARCQHTMLPVSGGAESGP